MLSGAHSSTRVQWCLPSFGTHIGMSYTAAADQSRMMQEQMTGATMAIPADTNKAFKVRCIIFQSCTKALNGSQRVTAMLSYPVSLFCSFSYPQSTASKNIQWKIPKINKSQSSNCTVLSSVMKSCALLLHPVQDMNHPFVQCIHITCCPPRGR